MKNVLIIAPHVDDEVIGCWSVLKAKENKVAVLYLYETEGDRYLEALRAAKHFDFDPLFGHLVSDVSMVDNLLETGYYDAVYVPSRRDWHADHKAANSKYRKYATAFYSVDMARGKLLEDREAKLMALDNLFPSQANLWRNNGKYWLFEDISPRDYDFYRRLAWTLGDGTVLEVTADVDYALWIEHQWYPKIEVVRGYLSDKSVDALLSHCKGRVIIKDRGGILEAE